MRRLLLATTNPGKLREFRRLLDGSGFELVSPADLGLSLDVPEHGTTYAENAATKARAYAEASGLPALADDSGIEVDALGGRPGVQSARYGGNGLNDEGRTALLLRELEGVPDQRRSARYQAAVAVAFPGSDGEQPALFLGTQEGRIGREPRGTGGFGYDPVFLVGDGRTQAELSDAEKDAISHRGKAMRAAAAWLRERST
ncbi:MAG TPA: RdgB/HAM1 family non-canonical purine NTP pyrophosphatase [Solirubrobacterales bacterium]|nr:RdgB/HAM1 family non-canonical purine NTP pyrophosphatase [Solirubrobacterales bacterium]